HDRGVELGARVLLELVEGGLDGYRVSVRSVVRHRVVRVDDGEDASGGRDLSSSESGRISVSVPAFVMARDDIACEAGQIRDLLDDALAENRVKSHLFELVWIEPARLAEDCVGN